MKSSRKKSMRRLPPVKRKKMKSLNRGSSLSEAPWMNETVVQAILGYLESSEPPGIDWPRHWFEEVWLFPMGCGELDQLILDHLGPAEDTIDEFAIKMTAYAATSDGKEAGRIFSIAATFAWECLENIPH